MIPKLTPTLKIAVYQEKARLRVVIWAKSAVAQRWRESSATSKESINTKNFSFK